MPALNQSLTSLKLPCLSMVEWCSRHSAEGIRGSCRQILCCADRQSTGNRRSTREVPKNVSFGVVVQKPGLGGLISKRPAAAAGRRNCHPGLTEPPPQKAPGRRGGGARRGSSARARAVRGWGQGAGTGWRCLGEHARRAGRDSFMIKDAKSETTARWKTTRGFQICSQNCRARSVAPAKVCRARQFIRRFNHSQLLSLLSSMLTNGKI